MANQKYEIRTTTQLTEQGTVEVLYQKMGDRWFAFSLVGEEVFVGSITQDEIDERAVSTDSSRVMKVTPKRDKLHKIYGNS